jgi:spore maturation protein CgeB
VPTIRVFEALACGIPLISAPWMDSENLFTPGSYLKVRNGEEMGTAMRDVCNDPGLAQNLSARGLEAILARHTCAHRADQLMEIAAA